MNSRQGCHRSPHHLARCLERKKVARIRDDPDRCAGDGPDIGLPFVRSAPVALAVDEKYRTVDLRVLPASLLPARPVMNQRHEGSIMTLPAADLIHLPEQCRGEGLALYHPALED